MVGQTVHCPVDFIQQQTLVSLKYAEIFVLRLTVSSRPLKESNVRITHTSHPSLTQSISCLGYAATDSSSSTATADVCTVHSAGIRRILRHNRGAEKRIVLLDELSTVYMKGTRDVGYAAAGHNVRSIAFSHVSLILTTVSRQQVECH